MRQVELKGRVFITFDIEAVTGLHIGGSDTGIEIGGVDKTVIRDPLTNRPYIPGSSLKGKMRSLLEKYWGLKQNQNIGRAVFIHACEDEAEYRKCPVCQVFGLPGERTFGGPTRLIVRDTHMSDEEAERIARLARTDLPYTEVKTEVSIDRVTSAANPRQLERVPAGTTFGPAELVYSVYSINGSNPDQDVEWLKTVIEGMKLLEDDYLGGQGSRGSGKVKFRNIQVRVRKGAAYLEAPLVVGQETYASLDDLANDWEALKSKIREALDLPAKED